MIRTFVILGLIVVVGCALLGVVLGIASFVLVTLLKLAIVGAIVYLVIRVVSPRTAQRIRERIENQSFPRF